jgi:8-oxo-dGTP diphosphatase
VSTAGTREDAALSSRRPILAAGAGDPEHPAAGYRDSDHPPERYDDWTLPKGKLDVGESLPACAVREVGEETGVTIRLSVPLDSITYEAGNAGLKKVHYWGGVVLDSVRRAPDAEVDVVSWLPVRAALGRLTYSHDHFLAAVS